MAWISPRTWVVSEKITAAIMNTHIRDNLSYLYNILTNAASVPTAMSFADGTTNGVIVGSRGRVASVSDGIYMSNNATSSDNGATWNRVDITKPAWLFIFGTENASPTVPAEFLQAQSGANPITWTTAFSVDNTGKIAGKGFYDSGDVSVTTGTTQSFTHGLAAQPRLYSGQHNGGSGAARFPVAYVGAGGTTVAFVAVDSANVQIINNSGGTRLIRACAMI